MYNCVAASVHPAITSTDLVAEGAPCTAGCTTCGAPVMHHCIERGPKGRIQKVGPHTARRLAADPGFAAAAATL